MLTFDEALHEYRYDGKIVPSVTQIMSPLFDFSFVDELKLEIACGRGTQVHKACELYDKGELDESGIDDWPWVQYFNAYKKFRRDSGFVPETNEERVYNKVLGYAGTLDIRGPLNGKPALIDIKTTATLSPVVGVQLSAYETALVTSDGWKGPSKFFKYALQLRADGTYRLEPYLETWYWPAFFGMASTYNLIRNNNLSTQIYPKRKKS